MTPSLRHVLLALGLFALFAQGALCADAAVAGDGRVTVVVDRTAISASLGERPNFRATIVNGGVDRAVGLVVNLNVVSLRSGVYVDPEDWSSRRTRYLAALPTNGSVNMSWNLRAVNAGRFAAYVVVLDRDGAAVLAAGSPVVIAVARRETLSSGGILPLTIGIPVLIAAAWLVVRRRRAR
jgi:hypothetical protein